MELFMLRCLELAACGRGLVAPNPMVGAVIVSDGRIIGEGYHRCFGGAHAEVHAIASVKNESLLGRSVLYVNLEPCSHNGKTAPCAELIIQKKIPRVVVACFDPYSEVSGRGIEMLRNAGVEVTTGVMEQEAIALNRFFMTAHNYHRPYIILKWAQSEDHFIDRQRNDVSETPTQFSTPITRMMAHQIRSEVQAIMVGTNTAIKDDPSLTVRYWSGKSPVRVLVDRNRCVPQENHLFDGKQQTLVFTCQDEQTSETPGFCEKTNVKYLKIAPTDFQLKNLVTILYQKGIQSLLVEGGAHLHRAFIEKNIWDEAIIETAPVYIKDGIRSAELPNDKRVQLVDRQAIKSDYFAYQRPSIIERYVNRTI